MANPGKTAHFSKLIVLAGPPIYNKKYALKMKFFTNPPLLLYLGLAKGSKKGISVGGGSSDSGHDHDEGKEGKQADDEEDEEALHACVRVGLLLPCVGAEIKYHMVILSFL